MKPNPVPKQLKPFTKGDPRINRKGRPKSFDDLRVTADMIASEMVPGPDGKPISRGELLLRNWIKSRNPILQRAFMEYWVGKVPDKLETTEVLENRTPIILHYAHRRPDLMEKARRDAANAFKALPPSDPDNDNSRQLNGPDTHDG